MSASKILFKIFEKYSFYFYEQLTKMCCPSVNFFVYIFSDVHVLHKLQC